MAELRIANLSRDQMALWIFEGMSGLRPPKPQPFEQTIAELDEAPNVDFDRFRTAADHVMQQFMAALVPQTKQ